MFKLNREPSPPKATLSLDWWAVILSIAAALLVKSGVLGSIPW